MGWKEIIIRNLASDKPFTSLIDSNPFIFLTMTLFFKCPMCETVSKVCKGKSTMYNKCVNAYITGQHYTLHQVFPLNSGEIKINYLVSNPVLYVYDAQMHKCVCVYIYI